MIKIFIRIGREDGESKDIIDEAEQTFIKLGAATDWLTAQYGDLVFEEGRLEAQAELAEESEEE